MTVFETHPREVGPAVVTAGVAGSPAILVLDPDSLAKHDDIPASWHHLLWRHQVLWCRLPAMHSLTDASQLANEVAALNLPVDVVAGGTGTAVAVEFSQAHQPRSLLLADPATVPDGVAALREAGVRVAVLGAEGETDRRTLGHPDVAAAVTDLVDGASA